MAFLLVVNVPSEGVRGVFDGAMQGDWSHRRFRSRAYAQYGCGERDPRKEHADDDRQHKATHSLSVVVGRDRSAGLVASSLLSGRPLASAERR